MSRFAHLHTHSLASLRDAVTEPEAMMRKAAEHEMPVSLTDHGTLSGIWEAAKYADKYGVRFAPGMECYVVPDVTKCRGGEWANKGSSGHLVLNAVDNRGWFNLLALNTKSNFEGYYCQPRVDFAMLREHADGIFVSSACVTGDTQLLTSEGLLRIVEIIEIIKLRDLYVLSFEEKSKRAVFSKILWGAQTKKNASLLKIVLKSGRTLRLTPDHLVFTDRGWKEAQELLSDKTLKLLSI